MADPSDFKEAVQAYIELHDEIDRSSKKMRELKKQKVAIGETILAWMKAQNADECEFPDGKLIRKKSKRTEGMKKEYVLAELTKLTGNEAEATLALNNINSRRGVVETEILSRTVKRGSNTD